ncbi:MAG: YSIRK-type signal peptide-containing protein, partial [Limosilactobacillus sp.]|uniref:YSIRK-type signal peptide-containing protein n=1 Tax=Limosilactobacillus sp. TaxID=2773925 RepID=UPI002710EA35|nr:YSIRK-type signal peptide-containing protein [Limosilactobacillus sp.]
MTKRLNKSLYAAKQKPHFALRKLSIGVASVLLSTTFFLGVSTAAPYVGHFASFSAMADDQIVDNSHAGTPQQQIEVISKESIYGVNNRVSTMTYMGHDTYTDPNNGRIQDRYTFLDYNENPQKWRQVGVYGIYGMDASNIKMQYQASDANGNVTGSLYDVYFKSNQPSSSETADFTTRMDEDYFKSNYVRIQIYILRNKNENIAGFRGIAGISGNSGSPSQPQFSPQAMAASPNINKEFNPNTPSDFTDAKRSNLTANQQTYNVGDKPTTVGNDQVTGTQSENVTSITYTGNGPDTSVGTASPKNAEATVTFKDGSTTTIQIPYVVTDIATSTGKDAGVNNQTYVKGEKVPDLKPTDVTGIDTGKVDKVEWVTTPNTDQDKGTYNDATAKITFSDGSVKTDVPVSYTITETYADKITPNIPGKTGVTDTTKLTDGEKDTVKGKVEDANKNNFPEGTTVTISDDGTTTITYPDDSIDTIPGTDLVYEKTYAEKITPKIPDRTEVGDTTKLTDGEKDTVKGKVEDANKNNFPEGTTVTIGDDGTATITYPDGSVDTIPGTDLVYQNDKTTDADKITPKVPGKTGVTDTTKLT